MKMPSRAVAEACNGVYEGGRHVLVVLHAQLDSSEGAPCILEERRVKRTAERLEMMRTASAMRAKQALPTQHAASFPAAGRRWLSVHI